MFSKLYLCYDKNWEIKLCISVNIYHILPKLGMSTHVFKINLCYNEKWEIKLCISLNIYHRLLKMGNKVMYLSKYLFVDFSGVELTCYITFISY